MSHFHLFDLQANHVEEANYEQNEIKVTVKESFIAKKIVEEKKEESGDTLLAIGNAVSRLSQLARLLELAGSHTLPVAPSFQNVEPWTKNQIGAIMGLKRKQFSSCSSILKAGRKKLEERICNSNEKVSSLKALFRFFDIKKFSKIPGQFSLRVYYGDKVPAAPEFELDSFSGVTGLTLDNFSTILGDKYPFLGTNPSTPHKKLLSLLDSGEENEEFAWKKVAYLLLDACRVCDFREIHSLMSNNNSKHDILKLTKYWSSSSKFELSNDGLYAFENETWNSLINCYARENRDANLVNLAVGHLQLLSAVNSALNEQNFKNISFSFVLISLQESIIVTWISGDPFSRIRISNGKMFHCLDDSHSEISLQQVIENLKIADSKSFEME